MRSAELPLVCLTATGRPDEREKGGKRMILGKKGKKDASAAPLCQSLLPRCGAKKRRKKLKEGGQKGGEEWMKPEATFCVASAQDRGRGKKAGKKRKRERVKDRGATPCLPSPSRPKRKGKKRGGKGGSKSRRTS